MLLNISYPTLPLRNSVRASQVVDYFGISHDAQERVLAKDLDIPLQPGDVVLFTGPSGSGKSSLLNALERWLEEVSPRRGKEKSLDFRIPIPLLSGRLTIAFLHLPPCLLASVVNPHCFV